VVQSISAVSSNAVHAAPSKVETLEKRSYDSQTDVFLSHDWGKDNVNHKAVSRINDALKKKGIRTWFDENSDGNPNRVVSGGSLDSQFADGIDKTTIVLFFVTENYWKKIKADKDTDRCWQEFNYAVVRGKAKIPVVMEKSMERQSDWTGRLGALLGSELYFSFADAMDAKENSNFDAAIDKLYKAILDHLMRNTADTRGFEMISGPRPD
jgi:hypothetical protein